MVPPGPKFAPIRKEASWWMSEESWSWARHAKEEVLPRAGASKTLRRVIVAVAKALGEGRLRGPERHTTYLHQLLVRLCWGTAWHKLYQLRGGLLFHLLRAPARHGLRILLLHHLPQTRCDLRQGLPTRASLSDRL